MGTRQFTSYEHECDVCGKFSAPLITPEAPEGWKVFAPPIKQSSDPEEELICDECALRIEAAIDLLRAQRDDGERIGE